MVRTTVEQRVDPDPVQAVCPRRRDDPPRAIPITAAARPMTTTTPPMATTVPTLDAAPVLFGLPGRTPFGSVMNGCSAEPSPWMTLPLESYWIGLCAVLLALAADVAEAAAADEDAGALAGGDLGGTVLASVLDKASTPASRPPSQSALAKCGRMFFCSMPSQTGWVIVPTRAVPG